MSHHYSGPDFGFPHGDARLDITDLYAFQSPGIPNKTVLVMNVHPGTSVSPRKPTTPVPFAHDAIYEIKIDTNGDAIADIAYRIQFSSAKRGVQTATLRRAEGEEAAKTSFRGEVVVEAAPVSTGQTAISTERDGYRFFAGWRSDPYFFDTLGALNNLQFTGEDFFTGADVCSIVLEVPNAALGFGKLGLWHRTLDGSSGEWIQADRGALPSQSVFLTGEHKGDYLAAEPVEDAQFVPIFAHSLEHTGGYTSAEAIQVAKSLLPDMLSYDPALPASYPSNGRTLTDDVMDHFIPLLTNGKITKDDVGPHTDLLAEFPFVGPPHRDRSAELN